MNKTLILLGASIVTQGIMLGGAEARLVRYEINGQEYTYSTNNRAQAAEARKRIAAAKAVEVAKAKAAEDKSRTFLTVAFGSETQKEVWEAEERLEKIMAGTSQVGDSDQLTEVRPAERTGRRSSKPSRRVSAEKPSRPPLASKPEPAKVIQLSKPGELTPAIAETPEFGGRARVKSVSFDVEAGIKTTIMVDGTIEEEPLDSSVLSYLAPETDNSLTAFVNQLRKIAPEDETGSIRTSVAEPEDGALIRHR